MKRICLVSCSKTKESKASPAQILYSSQLFKASREFAKANFQSWFILSAKYGLVRPDEIIEPYDVKLSDFSVDERGNWAGKVLSQLAPHLKQGLCITFLAGIKYIKPLERALRQFGCEVHTPLAGMRSGERQQWLKAGNKSDVNLQDLDRFYNLLGELAKSDCGLLPLKECNGSMPWPKMGVYFFLDKSEPRTTFLSVPRVVRVGTHAVSKGSSTELWTRLRAHRGSADGRGNHRGSVFRLHVGKALIEHNPDREAPQNWGIGSNASSLVRSGEVNLEREVSRYIGDLLVCSVEILDAPGPASDRAYIEQNAIALLSSTAPYFDRSTDAWLGRLSPHDAIRSSSLWNVNHVVSPYDRAFLDVLATYIDSTLGRASRPSGPIAPKGWHHEIRNRQSVPQISKYIENFRHDARKVFEITSDYEDFFDEQ